MKTLRTTRTILAMLLTLRHLRHQESWTRQEIDRHQSLALAQLRTYAYKHSPFYREFHAGLADQPLNELPVFTKSLLHEHFNDVVTDPSVDRDQVAAHVPTLRDDDLYLDRYIVNASSGTSGKPSYILFNRAEWAIVLASFARFERHIGSLQGMIQRPRMAIIASATSWHMSARIGATTRSSWLPKLRLDVGEPLDSIVHQLNAYQPQILATYASMAGILAGEQKRGRLRIAPHRIVSTAEVLSSALRERIQAVWGEVVFDQYGATEGGTFAVECQSNQCRTSDGSRQGRGLHFFEDLFILEVVDAQNRPVPPGEYGDKVLLTVLFNRSLPLIRYELNDSIRMSTAPCPCGCAFKLIDSIRGRNENVLRLPGRNGGMVSVHPMVFYRILDVLPVRGWQVVQEDNGLCLRLQGEVHQVHERSLVNSVREALARLNAVAPEIVIQWTLDIERGTTGKAVRIIINQKASTQGGSHVNHAYQ